MSGKVEHVEEVLNDANKVTIVRDRDAGTNLIVKEKEDERVKDAGPPGGIERRSESPDVVRPVDPRGAPGDSREMS